LGKAVNKGTDKDNKVHKYSLKLYVPIFQPSFCY